MESLSYTFSHPQRCNNFTNIRILGNRPLFHVFVCVLGNTRVADHLIMPLCSSCHTWILSSHCSLLSLCWSRTLRTWEAQVSKKHVRNVSREPAYWSGNKAHVTFAEAGVHCSNSLVCGLPYCSRHTWPAPRRRPEGPLSLEGSRCHHLRFPPLPAGRIAAVWHPGLTPLRHPRGRTWHGT